MTKFEKNIFKIYYESNYKVYYQQNIKNSKFFQKSISNSVGTYFHFDRIKYIIYLIQNSKYGLYCK